MCPRHSLGGESEAMVLAVDLLPAGEEDCRRGGLPSEAAIRAAQERHAAALESYRQHMANDFRTRAYLNHLARLAHALDAEYSASSAGSRNDFGAYILITHLDDRSDYQAPSVPVQTETVAYANPIQVHGQHCHGTGTADSYLMEPGGGSKRTNCVKDEWCVALRPTGFSCHLSASAVTKQVSGAGT